MGAVVVVVVVVSFVVPSVGVYDKNPITEKVPIPIIEAITITYRILIFSFIFNSSFTGASSTLFRKKFQNVIIRLEFGANDDFHHNESSIVCFI